MGEEGENVRTRITLDPARLSRMKVRRTKGGEERDFVYAVIMTYEKRGDDWVRVGNASTFA